MKDLKKYLPFVIAFMVAQAIYDTYGRDLFSRFLGGS